MSILSDHIEQFIKSLLNEDDRSVELQRNELAGYFGCAPSQINYVLATRFTVDQGYLIESRRGGGGYIRVIRLALEEDDYLLHLVTQRIGDALTENQAAEIIKGLAEQNILTLREATIIRATLSDKALSVPVGMKDVLRARLFRSQLLSLMAN